MCKRLICLALFIVMLALAGSAVAQFDPAAVTDGHVYLFEDVSGGSVPDDSANSNAGTIVGNPEVVDGLNGKALQFDGVDDGVNLPDSGMVNTGGPYPNRTVIAIFKCDDVDKPGMQTIFEEGGRTRGLTIYVFEGQVYVGGWNRAEYDWNPGSWISAPISSGNWYGVALVIRDGAEAQEDDKFEMWLDGALVGKAVGGRIHSHSNDNAIGYTIENNVFHDDSGSGDGWYFEGAIDELWILNVALTEVELGGFAGRVVPFAFGPTPADGALFEATWANLAWNPGGFAVSHDVYFG
ncbi:MAG: LamG-like jellyroll fold domain-containing protein, partial [Planctomycetota bacterium]|nr:LamG-like jellyroll fold domain-containing protein [Planctomycetota bacterium]